MNITKARSRCSSLVAVLQSRLRCLCEPTAPQHFLKYSFVMIEKAQGLIFDLDGTIIDSSWVWDMVDIKFLGDRGFQVPEDYVETISPMGAENAAVYTIERFGLYKERPEDLVREWFDMAKKEYKDKVQCKPYAKTFIKKMKEQGKKLSIATSSDKELFIPTLEREGIIDSFDEIITVNQVPRGKNHPDIYIEAAKRMEIEKNSCVVFEDIITAIESAKRGGFNKRAIMEIADKYITTFKQLL